MAAFGDPPWRVDAVAPAALPRTVDVAVVGAGFAGLSTALELARRGVQVAVLEANAIGAGASGHTGAVALEGTAIGLLEGADDCLGSLARVTTRSGIDCDLHLPGCWELVHRAEPGEDLRPLWSDAGVHLCVADTVPGGTIDAGALVSGLARAATAAGATIHEHHPVVRMELGAARRLHTPRGIVDAGRIVVAVNAYTPTLLSLPVDLRPVLTLAVATAAFDDATLSAIGLGERHPFYTADMPYLWGRVLRDGAIVFGAGLVFPEGNDVRTVTVDHDEARAAFGRIEARIAGLHPALAGVTIERRWGGPIAFVPSRAPVLSAHPDDPRVVVTGGCAGHGVALSVRIGELVADHLVAGRPLPAWGALQRNV